MTEDEKCSYYMDRFYAINRFWPSCNHVWQAAKSDRDEEFADQSEKLTIAKQRIAELEKDCDILATNYDAARKASQFTADVADQALADLKSAEERIAQLEQALRDATTPNQFWLYDSPEDSFEPSEYGLIQNHMDNCFNNPDDAVGEEFRVMRSKSMPDAVIKITGYKTDENRDFDMWEYEITALEQNNDQR